LPAVSDPYIPRVSESTDNPRRRRVPARTGGAGRTSRAGARARIADGCARPFVAGAFLVLAACSGGGVSDPLPAPLPGARRLAIVVNRGDGTLEYVDRRTFDAGRTGPLGVDLHEIAVDRSRGIAYVGSHGPGRLLIVDLDTGESAAELQIEGFRQPQALLLSPGGDRLFATFPNQHEIGVLDPVTGAVLGLVDDPGVRPDLAVLSADGGTLWVSNIGPPSTVRAVNTETLAVEAVAEVGRSPEGLRPTPDGSRLLVPCAGSDEVVVLALPGLEELARIEVGQFPRSIDFSADGSLAYVANRISDTLSEIDLTNLTVRRELPTGDGPETIRLDPATGRLLVVNTDGGTLSIHAPDGPLESTAAVGPRPDAIAFWDR
jgi:YVTN family beta-propeller protein